MSSASQNKDDRINLRLKHHAKLMLERAASFEGQTVSEFVLNNALTRAKQIIREHELMRLNTKDSENFFNALTAPFQFNDKLLETLKEHDQRVADK